MRQTCDTREDGSIQNLEGSVVIRQENLDDDVHQQHDEAGDKVNMKENVRVKS